MTQTCQSPGCACPPPASPRDAAALTDDLDQLLDAAFFRALADPNRLALLRCIARCARPCSVTEVAECCSRDYSVVSRHLSQLARAGLLEATRSGRVVSYACRTAHIADTLRRLADAFEAHQHDAASNGSPADGRCC